MKRIYLPLLVLLGISISNVSACSVALYEHPHMVHIRQTNIENEFVVNVLNGEDGFLGQIILDTQSQSVKSIDSEVQIVEDTNYTQSNQDYSASAFLNGTELLVEVKDPQGGLLYNLIIDGTNITLSEYPEYQFIVSESLNLSYLVFPYDIYQHPIDTYPYYDNSSVFIIPLDEPENYTFTYSIDGYYFWHESSAVYDELHILQTYGQGADCVGAIYISYSETGFEFMYSGFAGESYFANLVDREFMTIINNWEGKSDRVEITNEYGEMLTSFEISSEQMLNALDGESSELLELPSLGVIYVMGFLILRVQITRKPKIRY